MRIKHLQLIDVLQRTGNMGQAAEEMRLTQSAATKILQDAEQIFDAVLFNRLPRGLVETSVGWHVIQYARRLLNDTNQMVNSIAAMKEGGAGTLAIGAIMATAPSILPTALVELRRRLPLLTIHLTASTSDEILPQLEQRKLELGLCRLTHPGQEAIFEFEPLYDEKTWVFVSHDHPIAQRPDVTLADIIDLHWVVQPWGSPARQALEKALAKIGVTALPSRVETTSRLAALNLVKHAGMVGMLPSTILTEAVARGELVRLPVDLPDLPSKYGLVVRRGEPSSAHALEFMSIIRAQHSDRTRQQPGPVED